MEGVSKLCRSSVSIAAWPANQQQAPGSRLSLPVGWGWAGVVQEVLTIRWLQFLCSEGQR